MGGMSALADLGVRLALGGAVGLAAAVAMNWPMSRQPEGFTPAFVVASLVRRSSSTAASFRGAAAVHHAAGVLSGALYALAFTALDGAVPTLLAAGGVDLAVHLLAVVGVVAVNYLGFSRFLLPRAGGTIHEERATAVRGQWLRSSLVFGAVLLLLGPILFASV